MKHSEVRNILYDYLVDKLPEAERQGVESHLTSCSSCSHQMEELREALALLPAPTETASDVRDSAYWASLALSIERSVGRREGHTESTFAKIAQRVRMFFTFRPAYVYAIGGSAAALLFAVLLTRFLPVASENVADQPPAEENVILTNNEAQQRISDYFRKSKTLLVGIANMRTDDEQQIDLTAERNLSRNLVHEARFLKHQSLDGRSERLVNDLEKILIELANLEETGDLPNVELIRSGIKQENLLFKIRMAEASYDTGRTQRMY